MKLPRSLLTITKHPVRFSFQTHHISLSMKMILLSGQAGTANKSRPIKSCRKENVLSDLEKKPDHWTARVMAIRTGTQIVLHIAQGMIRSTVQFLFTSVYIIICRMEYSLITHINRFSILVHPTIDFPVSQLIAGEMNYYLI